MHTAPSGCTDKQTGLKTTTRATLPVNNRDTVSDKNNMPGNPKFPGEAAPNEWLMLEALINFGAVRVPGFTGEDMGGIHISDTADLLSLDAALRPQGKSIGSSPSNSADRPANRSRSRV